MVSTIRDDLDVEIPAVMINSEVTAVREERAPTGLSMAPENLALPASAAVSRKNTRKMRNTKLRNKTKNVKPTKTPGDRKNP